MYAYIGSWNDTHFSLVTLKGKSYKRTFQNKNEPSLQITKWNMALRFNEFYTTFFTLIENKITFQYEFPKSNSIYSAINTATSKMNFIS